MPSLFDPQYQTKNLDSKIIASLERLSHVFRTFLWEENKKHQLSPIQLQILIFLSFHKDPLRTISHLAAEFQLTKATISDAVRILKNKKLITEKPLPDDKRIYTLFLTPKGKQIAHAASSFANIMKEEIANFPHAEKSIILKSLLILIRNLQQRGVVSIARMCLTCHHFEEKKDGYYCNLMKSPLQPNDLRFDCPEHQERR